MALWPWGRLSLQQKSEPGLSPGGKGGRGMRLTNSPPSCAVVKKSRSLNFLEQSGPLQACNGNALPFMYMFGIGQEVKTDNTKQMVISRDQNAGQIRNMKTDSSSFERVERFKYLGTDLTYKIPFRNKLRAD
jgi:hypothetical protein